LFALVPTAASCAPVTVPAAAPPESLTVQLSWTHSAQFAGFYAAAENGYYEAVGLNVHFVEGGAAVDRLGSVIDGTAQMGVAGPSELIIARSQGIPVRAVATIYRRDPFVFFALAESGITRPEDFVGKTILVRPRAQPILRAMMARVGITPDQYTEVADGDANALFEHDVDVANGFVTTQVIEAQQAGYQLNLIYPDDYGVHFYSDTIFAMDEFIDSHPQTITRFLSATFDGWTYAVEHPDQMGAVVVRYAPTADPDFETSEMSASLPFVNTGEDHIGWMKPEAWDNMIQTLEDQDVIAGELNGEDIYTMEFIKAIYGGES
jgi:NitT/TauT family transport system substrate-binding protein